jgi:hypothetical protein
VQKTKVTNSFGLNIYDLLYHEKLLISKAAVEELNQLLDPKRETGSEAKVTAEAPKQKIAAKPKAAEPAETASEAPKPKKEAKPKAEKKVKAEKAPADDAVNEETTENE